MRADGSTVARFGYTHSLLLANSGEVSCGLSVCVHLWPRTDRLQHDTCGKNQWKEKEKECVCVGGGGGGTAHLLLVDFSCLRLSFFFEFVTSYLQQSHKCMRNKDVTGVSFAFGGDSGSLCCT